MKKLLSAAGGLCFLLCSCGSEYASHDLKGMSENIYDWRSDVVWSTVKNVGWNGATYKSKLFLDVMSHTTDRYLSADPTVNAHETMHGLLNEMNNATTVRDQFAYYEEGKGTYVVEPKMHASKIKSYLPGKVRSIAQTRYDLYLVQQVQAYFPNVLYQFDEWNCYITNGRVAIEMAQAGTYEGSADEVDGAMDFLYFASAAAYGLSVNEKAYIENNKAFKVAFAMHAERSMAIIKEGLTFDHFSGFHAKALMEHYVSSPENATIRGFLTEWMGAAWTKQYLGF